MVPCGCGVSGDRHLLSYYQQRRQEVQIHVAHFEKAAAGSADLLTVRASAPPTPSPTADRVSVHVRCPSGGLGGWGGREVTATCLTALQVPWSAARWEEDEAPFIVISQPANESVSASPENSFFFFEIIVVHSSRGRSLARSLARPSAASAPDACHGKKKKGRN